MRVVGGRWRGRRLIEPVGRDVTRPTQDRVREACASMIEAALEGGIAGARVLDAFGGTGALGIEMLSRGASHATFVDSDRQAASLIRKNLASLGADPAVWSVLSADAPALAARGEVPGSPFDLVLADPPYLRGPDLTWDLLRALVNRSSLKPGAVVSFEHAFAPAAPPPPDFVTLREKRYGAVAVDLLRWTAGDAGLDDEVSYG
ncbi:methyltransferase [Coriobacterium glomerans PW2]|uniref:Methyltransferase n=1 Tax=Coriobacterium glomerans (strain ATCC 49209 / DSM 20642 / JCM 10262 / PW2) TaxID=700015 RepID=F2N9R4_CORGP|nr:16S rRNA (guanine(966)-N(2))-methyltransferase RsmD [Coriobacterium glomerans]AEB07167.1 methyltransferase [Coriobacterium glomerans PW2]